MADKHWVWILVFVFQLVITPSTAICRYGAGSHCAFPCRCTGRCDEETGECVDAGQCVPGMPSGFDWHGTGCRKGNVAYQKPAVQSGTWGGQIADYAVDGDINPDTVKFHCAHPETKEGRPAWWYVDLEAVHRVESVTLYNREGVAHNTYRRMSYFKITVGNSTNLDNNPECINYKDPPVPSAGNITLSCTGYGRYVGYTRLEGGPDFHLVNLCEVIVEGYKTVDCSGGNCQGTCDGLKGCSKCPNGTKYPNCKTASTVTQSITTQTVMPPKPTYNGSTETGEGVFGSPDTTGQLSGGAIAGIAIVVSLINLGLTLLVVIVARRRCSSKPAENDKTPIEGERGPPAEVAHFDITDPEECRFEQPAYETIQSPVTLYENLTEDGGQMYAHLQNPGGDYSEITI